MYVDAKHPLTRPLAKGIMIANNSTVGVWATSQSYAREYVEQVRIWMSNIKLQKDISIIIIFIESIKHIAGTYRKENYVRLY